MKKNKKLLLLGTLIATIGLTGCSGINQKSMSNTTNYDEISAKTEKYELLWYNLVVTPRPNRI